MFGEYIGHEICDIYSEHAWEIVMAYMLIFWVCVREHFANVQLNEWV